MNVGRFLGAVLGVWVVRTGLNFLYYGLAMREKYEAMMAEYPGVFKEGIAGFIVTDLLFAVVLVYLWVKAGAAFGTGAKGGAIGGLWIGVLVGVVGGLYQFFSYAFIAPADYAMDAVYQVVSLAIQGAVAGVLYKR